MSSILHPAMVNVPAGRIHLGVPACPPRSNLPWVWHNGTVVEVAAFQLGRTHVTNAEYRAFLAATGHPPPRHLDQPGYDSALQPVVGVSWNDATAYCGWLAQETGRPYRLPGDAEWEYAARGGHEGSIFPWGDALDPRCACFGGQAAPRNVGSFAPNGFGLHDMIGNAWAWCSDRFEDVSAGVKAINKPTGKDPADNRVLRGGSYMTCHYLNLWIAYRHEDPVDLRHESIGFRVAL
ncbi:MAG: SUMF1/EgtB/PvdO family nonheme iron enzyme [Verrucomicrobia bacterium]|nr:SUMF1/EgtB/PvdO family nonheme iron enzyme [Verrucomicrobiota bacterium]